MVRIKICGVMLPADAEAAVAAEADFVGLMFAEASRRRVTVEQARRILAALPRRDREPLVALPLRAGHTGALWFERCATALDELIEERRPLVVGVFADQPASLINSIAETLALDLIQLSGHESWEDCLQLRRPVIKTDHIAPADDAGSIVARAEAGTASMLLLDTAVLGALGGTGQAFDWQVGREVAARLPVMLAGGLTPENVGEAVRVVRPWGVDVSSGVERDGVKDNDRIAAFVATARRALAAPAGGGIGGRE